MLLSLLILKIEPGHYRIHVMDDWEDLGNFDTISISAAIREAAGHALPESVLRSSKLLILKASIFGSSPIAPTKVLSEETSF